MERHHSSKRKREEGRINCKGSGSLVDPVELVSHMKQQNELNEGQLTDDEMVRIKLLKAILNGENEKARNEMKERMSRILGVDSLGNDLRKESFYAICEECLELLKQNFFKAATSATLESEAVGQIARHAGNLQWLVAIMIKREIAQDFVMTWASQSELSDAYSKIAAPFRYEVSRVTATLLAGIGKGELYAYKNARYSLLKTWLGPLCEDYHWISTSEGIDKNSIEHGLGGTIFSLPSPMQQELFFSWLDKRLNSFKECPNLEYWPELWWTGSFGKLN